MLKRERIPAFQADLHKILSAKTKIKLSTGNPECGEQSAGRAPPIFFFKIAPFLVLSTGESSLNLMKQKHNIWCFRPGLHAASFCIKRISLVAVQPFFYVTTAFFLPLNLQTFENRCCSEII